MTSDDVDEQSTGLFTLPRGVLALGVGRMADSLGNSFLIVVLPLYIASGEVRGSALQLSEPLITGIVLGLFGLVSSAGQPIVGRLSDRIGRRKVFVVVGLLLFSLANFSYWFAHSYTSILAARTAQGVAAGLTITASVALVSELSSRADRGRNMGVYNSFRMTGFALGPLAAGATVEGGPYTVPLLGSVDGFEAAFLLAASAAAVSTALVGLIVRDPDHIESSTEPLAIRIRATDSGKWLDPIFSLGLATFFMSSGLALLGAIEPEINRRLSQGPFLFSVEFSAFIALFAVGQPLVGRASDRYGRKMFVVAGLIALVPTTFVQGLLYHPWQMILARALQGLSAAMVFAPSLALAGDLAEKGQTGAQLSVLTVLFGLGISFGAMMSGYTIRFGYLTPFAVGAALAAVGVWVVQTQVEPDPRRDPE